MSTSAGSDRRGTTRRLRLAAAWALSAALVGTYYFIASPGDEATPPPAAPAEESDKLDIVEVVPAEATAGGALVVHFVGDRGQPVRAILTAPAAEGLEKTDKTRALPLEQLHARPGELVVRVPATALPGRHKLRLQIGESRDTRSKPYDLRVRPLDRRQLLRGLVGGLALLVFGLRTLSRGSREYTGQRGHGFIGGIARRTPTAAALGVVLGSATQFTTTAAGLVVGMIESHLLKAAPAAVVLLGAQLGAAAAPSLLGLASTTSHEGLLLVAIGVVWLGLADHRRGKALGKVILGCGLLFYGLHLLRTGLGPLVSDPELLPYIHRFQADHFAGLVACVSAGILLSAVLQGPAPVFALVLGLAQATGGDLQSALAILAGTNVGGAVAATVVAWPFGAEPRRMARLYFLMALVGTLVLAGSTDLWAFVADRLVSGQPGEVAYGQRVLLPHIGRHLATAFVLSQLAVTAALAALLPVFAKLSARLAPAPALPAALTGAAGAEELRAGLRRVLGAQRRSLEAIVDLCLGGDRDRGTDGEHALVDARTELEALFGGAARTGADAELGRARQGALAALQLQRALEDLLHHAERTTERAMALSQLGTLLLTADATTLKAIHQLLIEGLEALAAPLARPGAGDLDAARAREIRLNAIEAQARQELLLHVEAGEDARALSLRLNQTELVNAYETVGNHLYRLHEALAAEVEQE